ncbi:MAG: transposase [Bryobacteraceae bacterium]|nr:transposase [Bryobacteraceae bacterium]
MAEQPRSRFRGQDPGDRAAVPRCTAATPARRIGDLHRRKDGDSSPGAHSSHEATKPLQPGKPAWREFEHLRHGTRCLIVSPIVATGHVLGDVLAQRTSADFCQHIRHVARRFPELKRFHWVMDHLNTHWSLELCRTIAELSGVPFEPQHLLTGRERRAFLTRSEHRHVIQYTPKHGSWLNQIEIWFGMLQRRLLRWGEFPSTADLTRRLLAYIEYHNIHWARPYRWTYTGQPLAA